MFSCQSIVVVNNRQADDQAQRHRGVADDAQDRVGPVFTEASQIASSLRSRGKCRC